MAKGGGAVKDRKKFQGSGKRSLKKGTQSLDPASPFFLPTFYFFSCFSHSSIETSKSDNASHFNRPVRCEMQLKLASCIHVIKFVSYLPAMASDARQVPIFTYGIHIVPIHIYLHVEALLCQEATSLVCLHSARAVLTSSSVVWLSESVLCHTLACTHPLKKADSNIKRMIFFISSSWPGWQPNV